MTDLAPDPILLRPTPEARALGRYRYERAYRFFPHREPRSVHGYRRFFRDAGMTANLGLLSFLNAIGFDNDWCVRNIGCRPALALHYASRYGLGHDRPDTERLVHLLSPLWNAGRPGMMALGDLLCPVWLWKRLHQGDGNTPAPLDFSPVQIRVLLSDMLRHIGLATGYATPDQEPAS
ncbi:hypothetical protein [Sphingomonas sp. 1185]|uniref:hypothetical protein n=1 Tax=Sphingomonas sp. 1185 TaxID=3156411 RepID=UPI003391085B